MPKQCWNQIVNIYLDKYRHYFYNMSDMLEGGEKKSSPEYIINIVMG